MKRLPGAREKKSVFKHATRGKSENIPQPLIRAEPSEGHQKRKSGGRSWKPGVEEKAPSKS